MQNKEVESVSTWKLSVVYVLTIVLGLILFQIVWTLVSGVLVTPRIINDPNLHKELEEILSKDELKNFDLDRLRELPVAKRNAIESLARKRLEGVSWPFIYVLATAGTFGILGLIVGLLGAQRYVSLIPLCLLPATITIHSPEQFIGHSQWLTILIALGTQLVVIYAFSKTGAWLRIKLRYRRT